MKIAHLIDSIGNNGVTRVLLTLTDSMIDQGIDTTVLTYQPPKNIDFQNQFTCKIKALDLPSENSSRKFWSSKWNIFQYAEANSAVVSAWVLENKIDFVFVHGTTILGFHRLTTPYAVVAHSTKSKMFLTSSGLFRNWLVRRRVRYIYKRQPIVTVSKGVREDFIQNFGVDAEQITTIYNPLDIDRIRQLALEEPDFLPSKPYFVAAGNLNRAKRFDLLIRAFERCSTNADLVILGHGGRLNRLKRLARKLGIHDRVHLLGYKANPYSYFSRAIALVGSSDFEGMPLGMLEALACGTPLVSTDCPSGPREILQGELASHLVPVGDVRQLSLAMDAIAIHPYIYPEEYFERFNPSNVASQYIKYAKNLT